MAHKLLSLNSLSNNTLLHSVCVHYWLNLVSIMHHNVPVCVCVSCMSDIEALPCKSSRKKCLLSIAPLAKYICMYVCTVGLQLCCYGILLNLCV